MFHTRYHPERSLARSLRQPQSKDLLLSHFPSLESVILSTPLTVILSGVWRRVAPVPVPFPDHDEGAPGPSHLGTGDESKTVPRSLVPET